MIAIPNTEKPEYCRVCHEWFKCKQYDGEILHTPDDCPLIEIAEPTETLIHDIRKLIAFIDPHMIIASTYAEQIERAEAVKNWLLSIVGEPNADQHTQSVESVGEGRTDEGITE